MARVNAALTVGACGVTGLGTQAVLAAAGIDEPWAAGAAAGIATLAVAPWLGAMLVRYAMLLDSSRSQLGVLATQDDLTGVCNRRHFMAVAQREVARCRRYDTDSAVLLIDADHFRRVNNTTATWPATRCYS